MTCDLGLCQAQPDSQAPLETPQEEVREPVSDNDSEPYPEDDIPEEEDEEEDEEDDEQEEDDDKVKSFDGGNSRSSEWTHS